MYDDFYLLSLSQSVGKAQRNDPADVEALDATLRRTRAYSPPPEYANEAQRYATTPMIEALEAFQEQNGLKVDGYANPGGPTERAINNRLLNKPRGAGLLFETPAQIAGSVGNGHANNPKDVASIQRQLGALGHMPEDPFDQPRGIIDARTLSGIQSFQRAKGLAPDGWIAPGGEIERALQDSVSALARREGRNWMAFAARAGLAQAELASPTGYKPPPVPTETGMSSARTTDRRSSPSNWTDGARSFRVAGCSAPARSHMAARSIRHPLRRTHRLTGHRIDSHHRHRLCCLPQIRVLGILVPGSLNRQGRPRLRISIGFSAPTRSRKR
jgi:peptidoglycan hydrolase-like protein with peptidoglycan-binding domain